MKMRFEFFYKGLLIALACLAVLFFALHARGQQTNNAAAPTIADGGETQATDANKPASLLLPEAALTFGLDQYAFMREALFGIPLWQYCSSLIYIFLAFYISKLLDFFIRVVVKRWTAKTRTQFDDLLVAVLHGPVKVVSFVVLLHIGLTVFAWPPWLEVIISKGLKIAVAVSLTYMLLKLVDLFLGYWREKRTAQEDQIIDAQLFPILSRSLKVFIVVVAVLLTADNLNFNITGLLASLSIGGLALGLAAQDTVANIFGAISIFLDKPFRVGDRIQWDSNLEGTVEAIGLRSTRVRNLDGHLITVPNKAMGNATVTNVTERPAIRTITNLGITYDTPADRVELALKILEEIYRGHALTHDVLISFNKFNDSSLNLFVVHWAKTTDPKVHLGVMQELNLAIKRRFDEAGLSFAFPTQTVHLKQDSGWHPQLSGAPGAG